MSVTRSLVLDALGSVEFPDGGDIVSLGLVSEPFISDGETGSKIMLSLTVPASRADELESLRLRVQSVLESLDGVESAMVALTAEREAGSAPPPPPPPSSSLSSSSPSSSSLSSSSPPPPRPSSAPVQSGDRSAGLPRQRPVEGIRHIIAVASGKGGVGKSTTSVNLALGLRNAGLSVGVLDADIYGPSLPRLMNLKDKKPRVEGRTLYPLEQYGLKIMSIGFLVEESSPVIWRGPMVISALTQLLREVSWSPLDVLIVDMPPGTGDAQLTMAQQVPLSGAVIVSTPQDLALIDARKGLAMFQKTDVPILGIVENMSGFVCPHCGERSDIFGIDGARDESKKLGVPFLGSIPLDIDIRIASDSGVPVVESSPSGVHSTIYNEIASEIGSTLSRRDEAVTS